MKFKKVKMRKILRMPFLLSLVIGITIACGGGGVGNETGDETGSNEVYSVLNNIAQFNYQNGLTSADAISEEYLLSEYKDWFNNYVVDGGDNTFRVKRDASSAYDTVSEGMAYGMLIAVYFNDQKTFDKMYAYVRKHLVPETNLMHWKVLRNGTDISEFKIPVPHGCAWLLKSDISLIDDEKRHYIAAPSLDGEKVEPSVEPNWQAMADKENIGKTADDPDRVNAEIVKSRYVKASSWDRGRGSATDADLDIAMALVIASKKWQNKSYDNMPKPGFDYREYAARTIKDILTARQGRGDLKGNYLTNGTAWGGQECWNPSYFMPAWLRSFKDFLNDNKNCKQVIDVFGSVNTVSSYAKKCDTVLNAMYVEMKKISDDDKGSGLFPDWCDTRGTTPVKPLGASDRRYFFDLNNDGQIDDRATSDAKGNPVCDANGNIIYNNPDGVVDYNDGWDMLSTNFFYDAVRVPWRLATDYAWYGSTEAKAILEKTANFFKNRYTEDKLLGDGPNGKISTCLYDGYSKDGTDWRKEDRDGFNKEVAAKYYSSAFVAMCATSSLILVDDTENAKNWIDAVIATKDPQQNNGVVNQYTYYGNTLRLLSLLFMSGKFVNPETKVAIKGVQNNMYMTPADGFLYTDAVKGSATIGDPQKMGMISLGGDKIALRSSTGEIIRMYAEDPNYYNMLVTDADPYSEGIVIDNYDINPNAIFSLFDLIQGKVGSADYEKYTGFLNEAIKSHVYSSNISPSSGGITPMMVKSKNLGITDNNGLIRPQLKFNIEVIKR